MILKVVYPPKCIKCKSKYLKDVDNFIEFQIILLADFSKNRFLNFKMNLPNLVYIYFIYIYL